MNDYSSLQLLNQLDTINTQEPAIYGSSSLFTGAPLPSWLESLSAPTPQVGEGWTSIFNSPYYVGAENAIRSLLPYYQGSAPLGIGNKPVPVSPSEPPNSYSTFGNTVVKAIENDFKNIPMPKLPWTEIIIGAVAIILIIFLLGRR
ncbi:MAG: hypothetical protein M0016_07745 [Deltaproteobacteria bacterium]|jgi:hypothetical protein|nr:hypothetical protein [Deltaproteobacteria bacterium]